MNEPPSRWLDAISQKFSWLLIGISGVSGVSDVSVASNHVGEMGGDDIDILRVDGERRVVADLV